MPKYIKSGINLKEFWSKNTIFILTNSPFMYNHYHPVLKLKLFMGVLSESEKNLICKRTLCYWKNSNEKELTGFNANDPLIKNKEQFSFLYNHESAVKLLSAYMLLFSCFKSVLGSAISLNKLLRNKKNLIIKTYHDCKLFIKSSEFESLSGISPKKISRWENEIECENSLLFHCKSQNPRQLSFEEQTLMTDELKNTENDHLHICDIWANLLRIGKIRCKLETFYKYARIIVHKFELRKNNIKRKLYSIIAKKPLTVLHVDCTMIRTDDGGKWYLNIIYDNYSKAILGIKAMLNPDSFEVMQNLKEVMENYKLHDKPFSLYCDGGPENKGYVDEFLKSFPLVKKLTTSLSNGIHNNMIESFNAKFKRKLILALDLSRHENIPSQLLPLKILFNNSPQALIGTLSPNEVLSGLTPWKDIWPELEKSIENAKDERFFINKLTCCLEQQ